MLDKLTHHREFEFHICQLWTLQHEVISELLGRSLEHHRHFYVRHRFATTCFFHTRPTRSSHLREPISKVHSWCRLIVHHSFQQTHFSRCCIRFVLPCTAISTSRNRSVSQDDVGCNSEPFHRSEPAVLSRLSWPQTFSRGVSVAH